MHRRLRALLVFTLVVFVASPASAQIVNFTILHTNDFHGQLEPMGSNPGMARVAAYIKSVRGAVGSDKVLLVDSGDSMQGSLLSNIQKGAPAIAAFNAAEFAAGTLGNHDFDWGQVVLQARADEAAFPFVAANIVQGACDSWTPPPFATPYIIKTISDSGYEVRVAFIGVSTQETPSLLPASATTGLCFKDPADSILHYYDYLKANADVIVVLSHLGYTDGGYGYGLPVYGDQTLAKKLNDAGKPVSLFIGGHSHTNLASATTIGTTKVVQAYYNGRRVGRADFSVNTGTSPWTVNINWVSTAIPTDAVADPAMAALIDSYVSDPAFQALLNQPIGYAQVDLLRNYNGDNMMGNFINDSIYGALNTDPDSSNDVDMVFNNAGGLRIDWCDKEVSPGTYVWTSNTSECSPEGVWTHDPMILTYAHMFQILPFGNATVVGTMTGAQVLDLLNQSATLFKGAIQPAGIRHTFYRYQDANPGPQPYAWGAFDVCVINKISGICEPLDLSREYKVATNEFLAPAGQDGFLPFKYMKNITYWGDMLDHVNSWVAEHYTLANPYRGPNGDGLLDQRIQRDGADSGGSIIPVTILHHNDSHGNLVKTASNDGYTQLATLIKQERAHNPLRTLLLNAGDQIQGDPLMYYFKSAPLGYAADGTPLDPSLWTHPMMAVMNAMDYEAMTVGNHEFNFGKEVFASVLAQAAFPVLQANVADDGQYGLAAVPVLPYEEITLDGIKIALLGIGNHRISNYELPSNIPGLTFSDPIAKAQELSDLVRADNDIVVALTHIGFTGDPMSVEVDEKVDTVMAAEVTGIDAIIGGHSHTRPNVGYGDYKYLPAIIGNPENSPVIVHQAYRYNSVLGEVVLGLRSGSGGYEVVSRAGRYIDVPNDTVEDPAIKAIVDPYLAQMAVYTNTVIGETTVPIDALQAFTQETNAANLQADASVFELTSKGIDVDLHLAGAMTNRKIADSATVATPFTLKVSDMFALMPYENSLVVMEMNGPQLRAVLERAYRNYYYYKYVPGYGGYSYYTTCMLDINAGGQITYYDPDPPAYDPGVNHVLSLTLNGQEVDLNDSTTYYRVSTVNYLAAGSCNFNDAGVSLWPLHQITNDTQYYVRDAVINYIKAHGTISPAIEGRLLFTVDNVPPEITVLTPQPHVAVQDGVVFQALVTDPGGIDEVRFYIREDNGGDGIPIGYESIPASYNPITGYWEHPFDTSLLPDGNYLFFARATDGFGNESESSLVPFTIRNWAVMELLPDTPKNKAGRTMPVKFTLRMAPSVDPEEPFLYNTQLAVKIYQKVGSSWELKQTSYYGPGSTDYRISLQNELYITNFKTAAKPALYRVEVWRYTKNFLIDSFGFETVK
jgi:2',3'-cyclic-nucleotide 2'-phosphodiesterase (5'-nucleotidase family)